MYELVLQLIAENKETRNPYLDLGNCGLAYLPAERADCLWLETLILSNAWYEYDSAWGQYNPVASQNTGVPNRIHSIAGIEALTELKKLKKWCLKSSMMNRSNNNWDGLAKLIVIASGVIRFMQICILNYLP